MLFTGASVHGLLVLATMLFVFESRPLAAAPVPVRFTEGDTREYLVLNTIDGILIASGDFIQTDRGGEIESRMVFRFKDGSIFDETVVFTQQSVFSVQSYTLVQRGPVFMEDTEIALERTGQYTVKTVSHKDGKKEVLDGLLDLPPDIYNGIVLTVAKNLPQGVSEIVHIVVFTPAPRLIKLELVPAGERKVLVGESAKNAIHYMLKPRLGTWLKVCATLLGRMPPDYNVWMTADEVPAFVKFEGPLYTTGPVWRVELANPQWSD